MPRYNNQTGEQMHYFQNSDPQAQSGEMVQEIRIGNGRDDDLPKEEPIKRELLFKIFAVICVVAIMAGVFFAAVKATPYIKYEDIVNFTNQTCVLTDRFDQPIYAEGKLVNYTVFGNLVGHKENIHNSLLYRHADVLSSDGINPLRGYRALEKEPRVMKTTLLSNESQQVIASMFKDASGCCFAYNYETGEVYTALSFPAYDPSKADSSYINRCFSSVYIPGSTMKIVTAALAIDQGKNVEKIKYECKQVYTLSDGQEIKCTGYHGKIGFSTAIGQSCNCYFAQLIQSLNLEKALATLKTMGFSVNGSETVGEVIDHLNKKTSAVDITNTASFKNVWGLIGQGHSQVNPIDMARFAAAVVNGGKAAQPYIVASVTNPNKGDKVIVEGKTQMCELLSEKTANKTKTQWKAGVDAHYYTGQGMSRKIDFAKTGTAEHENGPADKLLMGVVESAKTAFYIVVEEGRGPMPMQVANQLVELLPSNG